MILNNKHIGILYAMFLFIFYFFVTEVPQDSEMIVKDIFI